MVNHQLYIELAAQQALKSSMKYKHGCVIVTDKGDILSKGLQP